MTLILTCLSREHIVQVADRRLTKSDGKLYDDDTNKAVFYCGRVAVGYTGLAEMEGKSTAEWIGSCMKDATETETAMNRVAESAEHYFQQSNLSDISKRLAVVATGWGTLRGEQPIRPFICVASNFMTDSWEWWPSAYEPMVVRTRFLNKSSSHYIFAAGQNINSEEEIHLNLLVQRAIENGAMAMAIVSLLGDMVQSVANRSDKVGKGMIIHLLPRKALVENRSMIGIGTPLTPDAPSFLYVSKEGRTDSFQGAVVACNGRLLTGFGGETIPPGGKGVMRTEMEESA